jgi:hypothetical protein
VLNQTLVPMYQNLALQGLPSDPDGHAYFVMSYQPNFGGYVILTSLFHATAASVPGSTPEIFAPFRSLPGVLLDTTLVKNVSTQAESINTPYGSRQTWWDTTIAATNLDMLLEIVSMWEASNEALFAAAGASPVVPFLIFHPITTNVLAKMQQNGGNALGLTPSDGPLMIVQLAMTWEDASLDALVEDGSKKLIAEVEKRAEQRGCSSAYVYMNYAGSTQQVQERYGAANFLKLKAISKRWDPQGKLAQLWKGYFKLK